MQTNHLALLCLYGSYSKTDEVGAAFDRINSLIKPGGNARIYPIHPSQIEPIKQWFSSEGIKPVFEHQPENLEFSFANVDEINLTST